MAPVAAAKEPERYHQAVFLLPVVTFLEQSGLGQLALVVQCVDECVV